MPGAPTCRSSEPFDRSNGSVGNPPPRAAGYSHLLHPRIQHLNPPVAPPVAAPPPLHRPRDLPPSPHRRRGRQVLVHTPKRHVGRTPVRRSSSHRTRWLLDRYRSRTMMLVQHWPPSPSSAGPTVGTTRSRRFFQTAWSAQKPGSLQDPKTASRSSRFRSPTTIRSRSTAASNSARLRSWSSRIFSSTVSSATSL